MHEPDLNQTDATATIFEQRRRRKPHQSGGKPEGWLAARRNHGLT